MKDEIIELKDENGKINKYLLLLVFKWYRTNKYYMVYTDQKADLNDIYDVTANIFDPNDLSKLEQVTNDFEWEEIERRLEEMGMKHARINH